MRFVIYTLIIKQDITNFQESKEDGCEEVPSAEVYEKPDRTPRVASDKRLSTSFRSGMPVSLGRLFRLGLALFLMSILIGGQPSIGQELSCRVQLDQSQLSGSEFSFLDDLERRIEEYMNEESWTSDRFLRHEQIVCSLQIIILESVSLSEFRARLVVTTRRPIHGTSQSTVVVRMNDPEWQFEYSRGTSLNHDLERYNALTSVLDFYAYVILGYDYDTFSELGGTPHFETARRIANRAEGNGDPGWSTVSSQRNRRQLVNEVLAQRHQPLREAYYLYHLEGLDRFVKEPEEARETVLEVVKSLRELSRNVSNSYPLDLFFSSKYQELAAVFSQGSLQNQAYNLLTQVDPSHSSEYNELVQ